MSNICPVCSNKSTRKKCENCGFENLSFAFLTKMDGNKWYRDTVLPHRENRENINHLQDTYMNNSQTGIALEAISQPFSSPQDRVEKEPYNLRLIISLIIGILIYGYIGVVWALHPDSSGEIINIFARVFIGIFGGVLGGAWGALSGSAIGFKIPQFLLAIFFMVLGGYIGIYTGKEYSIMELVTRIIIGMGIGQFSGLMLITIFGK